MYFPDPIWLEQAFTSRLTDPDIGALDRNLIVADFLSVLIPSLQLTEGIFVDWGAGYGILSRLMRDRGFDFRNHETFAEPIFYSPRFDKDERKVDLVVLSEVALHFDRPIREFEQLSRISDRIFFTAVVPPRDISPEWWYLMPATGLHVAFYSIESLEALANRLKMKLTSDGKFFHILHREPIRFSTRLLFKSRVLAFGRARANQVIWDIRRLFNRGKSLTPKDLGEVVGRS
jgi:hypothetical protein